MHYNPPAHDLRRRALAANQARAAFLQEAAEARTALGLDCLPGKIAHVAVDPDQDVVGWGVRAPGDAGHYWRNPRSGVVHRVIWPGDGLFVRTACGIALSRHDAAHAGPDEPTCRDCIDAGAVKRYELYTGTVDFNELSRRQRRDPSPALPPLYAIDQASGKVANMDARAAFVRGVTVGVVYTVALAGVCVIAWMALA